MTTPTPAKRMRLRYAGTCRGCSTALPAGEWAVYFRDAKQVECPACFDSGAPDGAQVDERASIEQAVDERASIEQSSIEQSSIEQSSIEQSSIEQSSIEQSGTPETAPAVNQAGGSARREYERRVAKREHPIRSAHPRLGGLILALSEEPQSTRAWARGAVGEEKLARRLDPLIERGARVLHDRRIPGTRANIDHLVIGPAGIFVIDAKRYAGRPQCKVEGGILRPRTEMLLVGRRDCTRLLTGMHKQLELVRGAVEQDDNLPVHGMLCFVDADWPVLGGNFSIAGVEVLWPKKVAERVFATALLTGAEIAATHSCLASAFPAA
ncbi:MAG: nuclease-related domain-containing protein [Jatrophihabitantaceae bacterium]